MLPPLPSSNRTCGATASGFPEDTHCWTCTNVDRIRLDQQPVAVAKGRVEFRSRVQDPSGTSFVDCHDSPAGFLRSAGVARLRRYYEPLRLLRRSEGGYVFPPPVARDGASRAAVAGLPGSWLFCRCPLSPITPESPTAARARCLAVGVRLHRIRAAGHSHACNEAESGSRLRITADIVVAGGLRTAGRPAARRSTSW